MPAFTPNSELDLLFSADLIPASVQEALGDDLHMRPLASTDHSRSHLSVLSILTAVPPVSPSDYVSAFRATQACPNTYFTLVIVHKATDQIVAVGSVFIEQKFIRGLGKVGHIEDIAVDKNVQGRKLGLRVIHALMAISEERGCYKTILNCSDHNIPFYEKCGFEKKENEMACYHGKNKTPAASSVLVAAAATTTPIPPVQAPRL